MGKDGVEQKKHEDICSLEEFYEYSEAAVLLGIEKIRITGGEPLVRKGILTLCEKIKNLDGLEQLTLTTNGYHLSAMAQSLKDCGVDRLNISLDTLKEDRFRKITRCGNLGPVLEGLEAALSAGFEGTKINVVLMKGFNDDEIEDFVSFAGCKNLSVRFIELMPIGSATDFYNSMYLSCEEVLLRCPELTEIESDGVSQMFSIPGTGGTVGLIRPISRKFCSSCSRLRITSTGDLLPCLHSDLSIPLRGLHGRQLRKAIEKGVKSKPQSHNLNVCRVITNMNEIGG